jgi:hypothetical protein
MQMLSINIDSKGKYDVWNTDLFNLIFTFYDLDLDLEGHMNEYLSISLSTITFLGQLWARLLVTYNCINHQAISFIYEKYQFYWLFDTNTDPKVPKGL